MTRRRRISTSARAALAAAVLAACGTPAARGGGAARGPQPEPTASPPVVMTEEVNIAPRPPARQPIVVIGRVRPDGDRAATGADAERRGREAIALLEAFIARNPGHPEHTPGALMRLGSLRLDVADAALDRGDEAAFAADTAAAVTALGRLVADFPGHARRDVSLYLLGYARHQAGDGAGALAAYEEVAAMPASPLALEARFRAGELHFEDGALDRAAAAYADVVARGDARFTALARYKLAWAHYRRDAYPQAIAAFQALLDMPDTAHAVADLRPEAAQYVAISLTERDWDVDGADDPAPRGAKETASVGRIAAHLGDGASASRRLAAERAAEVLADESRHAEAVAVYRLLIAVTADPGERARLGTALERVAARAR